MATEMRDDNGFSIFFLALCSSSLLLHLVIVSIALLIAFGEHSLPSSFTNINLVMPLIIGVKALAVEKTCTVPCQNKARESLVETEHQLKDLGQILKYAGQYKANRIYHIRYQKSPDKNGYLRRHETELLL